MRTFIRKNLLTRENAAPVGASNDKGEVSLLTYVLVIEEAHLHQRIHMRPVHLGSVSNYFGLRSR